MLFFFFIFYGAQFLNQAETICNLENINFFLSLMVTFFFVMRLVCFFDTARGPMSVVLVGAMIVSGITVQWEKDNCFRRRPYGTEARRARSGTSGAMKRDKRYDGCSRGAGGRVRRSCDRR